MLNFQVRMGEELRERETFTVARGPGSGVGRAEGRRKVSECQGVSDGGAKLIWQEFIFCESCAPDAFGPGSSTFCGNLPCIICGLCEIIYSCVLRLPCIVFRRSGVFLGQI